jgi:diguanylate cyclase (GGDEF)-like protein
MLIDAGRTDGFICPERGIDVAARRVALNPAFEATVTFFPTDCADVPEPHATSRLPAWLQRLALPLRRPRAHACDRSTGLYNRAGLFDIAAQALRLQRTDEPTSMIVADFSDLHEVHEIYGSAVARKVAARIVRRLRDVAGLRGFVGRTGTTQFTIVLPGATHHRACKAVRRALGSPARVEFDAGDSEIVLVPRIAVDAAEPGAESIRTTYQDLCLELARTQRNEERRMRWLASERERHSQPMSLPAR